MAAVDSDPDSSGWFWLSFVDPRRPEGSRFLGVAIVGPVSDFREAIPLSHVRGCNPGGQVCGHPVIGDIALVPVAFRHRLLTLEESRHVDTMLSDELA